MGLLSVAIWLPIAFGVLLLALGRSDQAGFARWTALLGAGLREVRMRFDFEGTTLVTRS